MDKKLLQIWLWGKAMGRQRRLKQQRINSERAETESEIFPTIEFIFNEEFLPNEDMNLDQPEDFTEADLILRRLMPMLPLFSGKNFELWAIKMERLLGSVDLWKFVQETSMNSDDKCRRSVALFLIISALDENILSSILNELGEVFDPKMFWHILETTYSIKWIQKDEIDDIVIKNSDCDESIIKTENMLVAEKRVACDSEGKVKHETCEVKYDENYVSHEEWLCLMHEKQLIDELLFGEKICLSSYTNQMQDDTTIELIKEVEIMNQITMKDEDLQSDVESKMMENSIATHEIVEDSIVADEFVKDSIIVDEHKKVNNLFEEELVHPAAIVVVKDEIAKDKFQEPAAMVNGKNVSLQSRNEKLHHYLMARKVKMKPCLQINKYGPFRTKTKMKFLLSCTVKGVFMYSVFCVSVYGWN